MRENIKNIVLILALVIGGISLPTSIISFLRPTESTTIVNEYYYNNTIIEKYNNTTIINNTIYDYPNSTIEFYHFEDVPDATTFFNKTYNITKDSMLIIAMTVMSYVNYEPNVIIRKNNMFLKLYDNDDVHIIVINNGSYNIEIIKTYVGFPNYDVDLFIGIF